MSTDRCMVCNYIAACKSDPHSRRKGFPQHPTLLRNCVMVMTSSQSCRNLKNNDTGICPSRQVLWSLADLNFSITFLDLVTVSKTTQISGTDHRNGMHRGIFVSKLLFWLYHCNCRRNSDIVPNIIMKCLFTWLKKPCEWSDPPQPYLLKIKIMPSGIVCMYPHNAVSWNPLDRSAIV